MFNHYQHFIMSTTENFKAVENSVKDSEILLAYRSTQHQLPIEESVHARRHRQYFRKETVGTEVRYNCTFAQCKKHFIVRLSIYTL